MAMHGEHMEAHPPMGLKGGSGEGGERSYQVPSKVQDEVGQSMRREDEVPKRLAGMHGGAWGRFIKLKYMEHACDALSEAEMAAHAPLSNHAWRCMVSMEAQ